MSRKSTFKYITKNNFFFIYFRVEAIMPIFSAIDYLVLEHPVYYLVAYYLTDISCHFT